MNYFGKEYFTVCISAENRGSNIVVRYWLSDMRVPILETMGRRIYWFCTFGWE